MFEALDIGASALRAQRTRLDTIAQNVANVNTTRDVNGAANPYKRRFVVFAPGQAGDAAKPGVHVKEIAVDRSSPQRKYQPGHPDAGPDGYVKYPNVDLPVEFVDALGASRAYEANVTMIETSKAMMNAMLRLIA